MTALDTAYNYDGFASHRTLRRIADDLLDDFEISTKVGFFPDGHDLDPERLRAAVKETTEDLGCTPATVLIHNPEQSPTRFQRACAALAWMQAEGLVRAWGVSSWDPRPLIHRNYQGPTPDVLMLRAGLTVPSAVLEAGERLTAAMAPTEVWGMAPFGHRATDPVWTALDVGPFLAPGQEATIVEGAFAVAYQVPDVVRMAVGTTRVDHLAQLNTARMLHVDTTAIARYRALIHREATVGHITGEPTRGDADTMTGASTPETATQPAAQRFDLRRTAIDDVLDRVGQSLQVRLDAEGAIRKRRSIGLRSDRATWIRIECRGWEKLDGQGWGLEAAAVLRDIPRPDWYAGVSWLDPERGVVWRADETALVEEPPVGRSASAVTLTDQWWTALAAALDALAAHRTTRIATPDCEPLSQERVNAVISKVFPGIDTTIDEYATAHADLNWANVTGPELWIIDWEDWGTAPRGLDAANLWFSSLREPTMAEKVREHRRADLASRTGKIMALWRCAEFLGWAGAEEPGSTAVRYEAERLVRELTSVATP